MYYITSMAYNVLYEPLEVELATLDGKVDWKQYFDRAWTICEFETAKDALDAICKLYPEKNFFFDDDTLEVFATWKATPHCLHKTSMKINRIGSTF